MSDIKNNNILPNPTSNGKKTAPKKQRMNLLDKANTLPKSSGCYFLKGNVGQILYVGKAKNLKARVASYFNNSAKSAKTEILVSHVKDFDFILTNSEVESLVLENNLIKEHKPKYNIMLRDDKTYPYLQVRNYHEFPLIEYVRRPKRKRGMELFGPFPAGSNISRILSTLKKAYLLRDCSDHDFKNRDVPCLLFQIKQCSAPCVGYIDKPDYEARLNLALDLFRGPRKAKASIESLREQMMNYASDEKFELAAALRDYIEELEEFLAKSFEQNVEALSDHNLDVVAFYIGESEVDISIYMVRDNNLLGHKNFHFLHTDFIDENESEIMGAVLQYYQQNEDVLPEKIVTTLNEDLSSQLQQAIVLTQNVPQTFKVLSNSKKYKSLIDATRAHAEQAQRVRIKNQDSVFVGLNKLKELLSLKDRPKTMECYDVAVWQGKSPTASQVVFYEGKPDKTQYRYYHLKELPEGNNDFAMMTEVFSRRIKHENFPDVFVVDGGVQQVNTVLKVLESFDLKIPVVGIAKARDLKKLGFRDKEVEHSDERLIIPGRSNPYVLRKNISLLRILVQMRDEAHRFSRKLHHKAESKRVIKSWIDDIKGINKNVKDKVRKNITVSKNDLMKMDMKKIESELGVETKHARVIYNFLHAEKKFN